MSGEVQAYVALGANLDEPLVHLNRAVAELARLPATRVTGVSAWYRSAYLGPGAAQPDYLNGVVALATGLDAETLLVALLDLEAAHGRIRETGQITPRPLDLDLLLHGQQVCTSPRLTLPHPRLHLRAFVLLPLTEIAPDLVIPGRGQAKAWLPAVATQTILRLP